MEPSAMRSRARPGVAASVLAASVLVILIGLAVMAPPTGARMSFGGRAPDRPSAGAGVRPLLPSGDRSPLVLDARVVDLTEAQMTTESYPVRDRSGAIVRDQGWRVVAGTGNCCENYLAVSEEGRLLDFGGDYLNYSDDQGQTWKSVRPSDPLPNFGEGTVALAPNGDVIGVAWNPYFGDRVVPFKYEVAEDAWYYTTTKLHNPFFDRESVGVVPGPFEFAGEEYPYVSLLKGGWPFKSPWYVSLDGLNYFIPSARFADQLTEGNVRGPLVVEPSPQFDWLQTQGQTALTALGPGRGIAGRGDPFFDSLGAPWTLLDEGRLKWVGHDFPKPLPLGGRLLSDSRGWLHHVSVPGGELSYMVSRDGGDTWTTTKVPLPEGTTGSPAFDSRANGRLGITAVAVHTQDSEGVAKDLVYRFTTKKKVRLTEIYEIGKGDLVTGVGVSSTDPRFDFANVVILPDGRLAVSFMDSDNTRPALAIQL